VLSRCLESVNAVLFCSHQDANLNSTLMCNYFHDLAQLGTLYLLKLKVEWKQIDALDSLQSVLDGSYNSHYKMYNSSEIITTSMASICACKHWRSCSSSFKNFMILGIPDAESTRDKVSPSTKISFLILTGENSMQKHGSSKSCTCR
jgi:hypothetical protein